MSTQNCPACGAPISQNTSECRYCGQEIAAAAQQPQPQYQQMPPQQPMQTQQVQFVVNAPAQQQVYRETKNKIVAGLLAIFLGGLGIHKFYLGRNGQGIIYLLFCWTYIPAIIGFIEGIVYLCSNEERFQEKYAKIRYM